MNKAKITPIDVLRGRLAQLYKEKEELVIDLERDEEEIKQRYKDSPGIAEDLISDLKVDQQYWRTEIYKYEFCIDEIERIIKMIES